MTLRARAIGPDEAPAWVELAWRARDAAPEPGWVPPLRAPLLAEALGRDAFAAYARRRALVVEDAAGRWRGRALAVVNPRLPGLGHLGHIEVVGGEEGDEGDAAPGEGRSAVVGALVTAARAWLRAEGAATLLAPSTGGAHRLHRALVDGFERPPFLLEPRTPAWLPAALEAAGLRPGPGWTSHELDRAAIEGVAARQRRLALRRAPGHVVEYLDPRGRGTLPRLHRLLDRAWAGHVGYAPLDAGELEEGFAGLLALMGPRQVGVVRGPGGADVGFGFVVPDDVDAARALDGDAAGWGRWLPRAGPPRRLVLHTFALVPEARGSGAASLMFATALEDALADGVESFVLALASDDVPAVRRLAPATRRYALFAGPV